jgi:DNA-binding transcriptional regulator/RsmH inhibitor MraZ
MSSTVLKEYTAKLDSKRRLTIRGSKFDHYKVLVHKNGQIVLKPQLVVDVEAMPSKTLKMIEQSMENFKNGKVYGPIDIEKYDFDEE